MQQTTGRIQRQPDELSHKITNLKQAGEELREAEEKYRTLMEEAPVGICHVDIKGKFTYVNKTILQGTGYSRQELVGKNVFKLGLISRETSKVLARRMKEKLMGKPPSPLEIQFKCKDGKWLWLEIRGKLLWEHGVPVGVQIIGENITERKQAEEELKSERDKLQALIDGLGRTEIGIDIVGTDYRILFQNQTLKERFGELAGKLCYEGYMGLKKPCDFCPMIKAIRNNKVESVELTAVDGRNYKLFSAPLPNPDGTVDKAIEVIMDITEHKQAEEALKESEEKYRAIFGSTGTATIIVEEDTTISLANEEFEKLCGYSREEVEGKKSWIEFVVKEDLERMLGYHKARRVGPSSAPRNYEFRFIDRQGNVKDIFLTIAMIPGTGKSVASLLDITERKRMEEALADEATRRRILADQSRDGIVILDQNGKVYEANQQFAKMLGYSPEEVRELHVWDWDTQWTREQLLEMTQSVDAAGDHFKTYHRRKDGTVYDVEISTNGAVCAGQKLIFCVCRDVTERKQAEEALEESEVKYRTLFEDSRDALYITTQDGKLVDANQSYLDLFGYTKEEAIGLDVRKTYVNPNDRLRFQQEIGQTGVVKGYELKLCKKDGTEMDCLLTATVRRSKDGVILGYQGSIYDITEYREMEERQRELQQELIITSRLASIGEMASGIAHEINNPLTGVIGFAQLLGQRDVPEDIKEAVSVINEGAQRVSEIVQKLLTFARRIKTEKEYVDINSILTNVLEMRSYEMRTNNIEVISKLASDLPWTMANVGQLQQVFLNIVVNAEQAMTEAHDKGKLRVKTERIDNSIRVSIADDGSGIAKEDIDRLFDPFFTSRDRGTGLGLSIAYGIINEHKGKIYAKSTLGKGATFIVELPIVAEPKQLEMTESPGKEPERVTEARIMVVDDEPSICQFLDRLLTREGHKVETILGAQTALQRMNIAEYDLFLVDIKMPGISGIELYNRMKEIDPSLQRKVIFIAGEIISTRIRAFLSKSRVPCLTKPFDLQRLKKEINRKLGQGA